jgi:Tol biopolymer transport system component/C-terminal processing protease CtpA/Prc
LGTIKHFACICVTTKVFDFIRSSIKTRENYMTKISGLSAIILSVFVTISHAQTTLSYMTEPSLSPDRREIAFVSGGDVWTVSSEGGVARLLVSHAANESRPLFSPDGRYLAFGSNRTGNGDIYILELATGNLRRLTFDDVNDQIDAWSRDGKWVYFSSSSHDISGMNDIYRVAASGGTPMRVSSDRYTSEFEATPLADGSIIFAARGNSAGQWWRNGRSHLDESELWQKTGEAYQQLTPRGAKQMWPMATADGSRIYFMSDRSGSQNIWSMSRGGQAKQITTFADGRVLWPSLSYDGQEIVFERNFRIWKMKTDGAKPQELAISLKGAASSPMIEKVTLGTQIRELSLSPDGKKVAVITRGEVFAASAKDGGEAVRVTNTTAAESFVTWSTDSKRLVYVSERGGSMEIYQYDFATETETQLTRGSGQDASPVFSPDGKLLAFIRNSRALMVLDVETKQEREVAKLYADPSPLLGGDALEWSPDGKWLAFLTVAPETRSYTNVNVVPAAGGAAKPISFLANSNSGTLVWSPDGSFILFDTGQRTEDGAIARIDLKLRTPKFREDQFRDLFKQENPKERPVQPGPAPAVSPAPTAAPSPATDKKEESKPTEIVFEDIRRRLSYINTGLNNGSAVISPDGKTLLVLASAEGQFNIYTMPLDELATDQSARQLTSTPGFKSQAQFSPDSKEVYFLENGRVNIVTLDRREVRGLNLNIEINVNFSQEKIEVFRQGWRYLRDNFYDDKFHGVDWNAMRGTYEPLIASARTMDEVRRLMNMMVGELNASHLGVGGQSGFTATQVGKLGLRFDRREFENNGRLKITEVISLSPSAVAKSINVGDYLLSVDGTKIDGASNLEELLEGKVGKRVVLSFAVSADGSNKRDVTLKPISTGAEKNLLYRQWVEANRAYVDKISGGKIGYVHLPDMGQGSLNQLYIDLDAENQSREGVVIDIRNNNGGFVNPYVIDVLSRRGYLTMRERGLWNVPARSALGQRSLERPTVLVTNQHSLSDAEDLTEGYKSLKLGKVVGEPTSGWIIYTWNTTLFDGTTFRLPRQLILGSDGKNMELNPRTPDIPVTRPIGETLTGKDSQLDRAVRELLGN